MEADLMPAAQQHDQAIGELPVNAAASLMGMRPDSVRRKVRKGQLAGRHDEAGRLLVVVPQQVGNPVVQQAQSPNTAELVLVVRTLTDELEARRAEVAGLIEVVSRLTGRQAVGGADRGGLVGRLRRITGGS